MICFSGYSDRGEGCGDGPQEKQAEETASQEPLCDAVRICAHLYRHFQKTMNEKECDDACRHMKERMISSYDLPGGFIDPRCSTPGHGNPQIHSMQHQEEEHSQGADS